jgi:N-acetylmuramoyl-L-alanine amidase
VTWTTVLLAAVLFIALAVLAPSSAQAQGLSYPDVGESLPSYDAIGFLSGAGIISGYQDGNFGPGDALKRGQATKMLVLWKGVSPVTDGPSFPDLDDTYRSYVETACAEGWITGYPDGRFKPYSTLTRQQMAIIMVRAMGWEEAALALSASQVDEVLAVFSDQVKIAAIARPYVAMAVSKGLFGGYNGGFSPAEGITRAQFCLVVFRAELSLRAVIEEVRSASDYPTKTRVVIDLSRAPDTVAAGISADGLLTIDFTGGAIAGTLSQAIESLEVTNVSARQVKYDPRTVRITLDLGRYQTFRVMSLGPSEDQGDRIVVDITRRTTGPEGDGPPLVCVDPGHGGDALGAVGVSGANEKDVNLAICLLLAEDLRQAGLRVMMTREDDRRVELQDRAAMANTALASVFVSVHNNAATSDAEGTETFYWGTSEEWSPDGKLLAEAIQRNLIEALGSKNRGAQTHWNNLVVLAETEMTSVLAEVGFMSNAAEEAKLLTTDYQQKAAQGVANGILEYLEWSTTVYTTEPSVIDNPF